MSSQSQARSGTSYSRWRIRSRSGSRRRWGSEEARTAIVLHFGTVIDLELNFKPDVETLFSDFKDLMTIFFRMFRGCSLFLIRASPRYGLRGLRGLTRTRGGVEPGKLKVIDDFGGDEFLAAAVGLTKVAKVHKAEQEHLRNGELDIKPKKFGPKEALKNKKIKCDGDTKSHQTYKHQIKKMKMELAAVAVSQENQYDKLQDAVMMLHKYPYEQQLVMKEKKHGDVIHKLKMITKSSTRVINGKVSPIIPSTVMAQYRSKVRLDYQPSA